MIEDWNDSEYCLMAVRKNPLNLGCVKNQTSEMCLEAVKRDGLALQYVKEQTPLIIHYLKKYHILLYASFKTKNLITVSENEMKIFYNENPHLLLTLYL